MELEDFIRQQLNSEDPAERFPFREEHWEKAEALLVLEERKAMRRKIFWWLLGACLLLLLAVSTFWRQAATASPSQSHTETQATQSSIQMPTPANTGSRAVGASSGATTTTGVFQGAAVTQSSAAGIPPHAGYRSAKGPAGPGRFSAKSLQVQPDAGISVTSTTANPNTSTQNTTEQKAQADTAMARSLRFPSGLQRLPLIDFKNLTPMLRAPELNLNPIILPAPVQYKGAAIAVGAPIYPDAPAGRQTGLTIGLYAAAELKQHWLLSIGIQWRYRPVSSLSVTPTDQALRYSFGYVLEESVRKNWGVHYLEAPISVQRRWHRLRGEFGLAPGMLLSASDRLIRQRTTQYPAETVVIESSYREGNRQFYNPLYIAAFTGGSMVLPRGIEAYGRCFYRPDRLRATKEEGNSWRGHLWPEIGLRLGL